MKNTITRDQEKRYVKIKAQAGITSPGTTNNVKEEAVNYTMHPLQYWASPNFFLNPTRKK
ncbi:MAG TPA: hypothetical protein VJ499_11435 [Flavisolibacter sp.]|nr:hypothetical protein [Flavisolibacter sp.]